jgi:hypothetical protein
MTQTSADPSSPAAAAALHLSTRRRITVVVMSCRLVGFGLAVACITMRARGFTGVPGVARTAVRLASRVHQQRPTAAAILEKAQFPAEWPFTPFDFQRDDSSDDKEFYSAPRLVYHIDDAAVCALTSFYEKTIPDGADVLDLASSWVSHFPEGWKRGRTVGLGMVAEELSKNNQLDEYVVQDLNKDPTLPFDDNSFDFVTIVVSVDYLVRPREIFAEMGRVLRPGGRCLISFSNRCFPTKVWQLWLRTNDLEHIFIVGSLFHYSGAFKKAKALDLSPNPGRSDPLYVIDAQVDK